MGASRAAACTVDALEMLHVVLFRPVIPSNTGNIGRTCLGFGARLHLIRPLGFGLTEKEVKRAGLDHWEKVDLKVHENWQTFAETELPQIGMSNTYLVSKRLKLGSAPISETDFFPKARRRRPASESAPSAVVCTEEGTAAILEQQALVEGEGGIALVFGSETDGLAALDEPARSDLPAVFLPMRDDVIRSYNLSNAVAMALYEVDRQRRIAAAALQ